MPTKITSRAVIGEFYRILGIDAGQGWLTAIGMTFDSDQASEEYAWIGDAPVMREWIGGRHAKGFRENSITLTNKHFEATIEVAVRLMRRDKTGQVMVRIAELAARTNSHWASLLSTLIVNAESTVCYDGQFFFDTDHSEGDSGTQSNDIQVDISTLPAAVHGIVTLPSVAEMQQAILKGVVQIAGFKDDQGEPMNELAREFLVMVPPSLSFTMANALTVPRGTDLEEQNPLGEFSVRGVTNTRLAAWTDQFAVFRADGRVKPFIMQEEDGGVQIKAKAEGSEFEFDNDAHQYGVDTWREAGYGYWQHACLVKMT